MKSKFDGGLLGLIGMGILTSLIITVTLGIATPWAVCMMVEWYAKHTLIDGKRVSFDGNGMQLFGNWIKWFILTVITFGIYGFWVSIKMVKWVVSHLHIESDPVVEAA